MSELSVHIGILLGAGASVSPRTKNQLTQLISSLFNEAQKYLCEINSGNFDDPCNTDNTILGLTNILVEKLEDSPFTNAATGSELCKTGRVECDASLMLGGLHGEELSASIGAVPDLVHPINLCHKIVVSQQNMRNDAALSIPTFLTGEGARDYGLGLGLCRGNLTSQRAQESYTKWIKNIEKPGVDKFLDTVGIIVIHRNRVCVASSSGGSLLKDSGRVGPAAQIGKGLDIGQGTAAVCSGFGEDISALRIAQKVCHDDNELGQVLSSLSSSKIKLQRPPLEVGVVRSTSIDENNVLFEYHHTTPSMISGFGCLTLSSAPKYRVFVSNKPGGGGYKCTT